MMADDRLGAVLARARERLRRAGVEGADLDARLLVAAALGVAPERLPLEPDRRLKAAARSRVEALIGRRAGREPVARILGRRDFWSLDFRLSPETLEPRPDTETLVAAALAWIDDTGLRDRPFRLADLGTGSGAVLVALLSECRRAVGIGTDLAPGALATARGNAGRAGVGARAGFACMSYGDGLSCGDGLSYGDGLSNGDDLSNGDGPGGGFALVVSNPPYVRSGAIAGLAPEVAAHDPLLALDGGADGLDGYRAIAAVAPALLRPDGMLMVEVGHDQAGAVAAVFAAAGLDPVFTRRDLAGHIRVVAARHHRAGKTQRQLPEIEK